MKLYQIVLKDVVRRKKRVFFAILGVVIGTMTVIGILTIARAGEAKIYTQLERYGPNLTVVPEIDQLDMKLGDLSLGTLTVGENYIPEKYLPEIRQIADSEIKMALEIDYDGDIAVIAPKLYNQIELNGVSVMAVGIEPENERVIKTWWGIREGVFLEQSDQALIGGVAAELLNLHIDDQIVLDGKEVLTVSGILEQSGSSDDYQIFVPLRTLQRTFGKEGLVSSIDIRALCTGCPVEIIAGGINDAIPGVRAVAVKQVAEAEMGTMDRINRLMLALAGVTLAIGLFGVINTMIASVNARIKDIGIMRAVGASRYQIINVFIFEAIIVGIIGGIFGYVSGTALAYAASPLIFEGTSISFIPVYLPLSVALATCISVIASFYPAYRATTIKVADSFRSL